VILLRFWGDLTPEDVAVANVESGRLIAEGKHPVHLITDTVQIKKYPSLFELRRSAGTKTYPGTGWQMIIVTHPVLRFFCSILTQLAGTQYRMVATRAAALAFLSSQDSTLPSLDSTQPSR
jgi:hypothetical protein